MAQDDTRAGINYDGNDRYCLDGERLMVVSGTYGADGSEYRTEVDGFTRIKVIGQITGSAGPEKFKVWTKSGQVLEYGYTADSRIEAQGLSVVRLWAVNKITDTAGNYLTVLYREDATNGSYRPLRIDYTGNTAAQLATYASVRFEYEARTDLSTLYQAGSLVKNTQRLTHIKTYLGNSPVRDYRLTYDNMGAAGVSRLSQIQECAGNGVCLPPTVFGWVGDGTLPDFDTSLATHTNGSRYHVVTGDWNGDGRTDIFLQHRLQGASKLYTAGVDGSMIAGSFAPTDWWAGEGSGNTGRTVRVVHAGDWNGDGRTDLARETIQISGNSSPFTFTHTLALYHAGDSGMTSNGYSLRATHRASAFVPIFVLGDYNGDGRTDVFLQQRSATLSRLYTAQANGHLTLSAAATLPGAASAYQLFPAEVDGDGRTDLIRVHRTGGAVNVYLADGSGFTAGNYSATGWHNYDVVVGDYNGDGLNDVFLDPKTSGAGQLHFARGDGRFVAVPIGNQATGWDGTGIKASAGDWNGDGKADLMRTGGDLYLGTGNGLQAVGFSAGFNQQFITAGDWNGDGLTDLWVRSGTYGNTAATQYVTMHSGWDVMDTVTDGLGAETRVTCAPLTDAGVYTASSGATYPLREVRGPLYVVKQVRTADGLGGLQEIRYRYSGARVDLSGRGFLGFRSMSADDVTRDLRTTTTYSQTFPYTGLVERTEQYRVSRPAAGDPTYTLIGKVASTYTAKATVTGHPEVQFPYASQVVAEDRELDGSLIRTTTTTSSYDSYGNPLTIKVALTDGTDTYTTFTDNTYTNTETSSSWLLGRLTRAEVTRYLPGNTDTKDGACTAAVSPALPTCASRVSGFAYDSTTGLLTREVIEPDTATLKLQTDYTHDSYGNRLTATVSGGSGTSAITTRATTMTYDTRGQFAVSVTNALGHRETRTFDKQHGGQLTLTGPNGLTTSWEYDALGRLTQETRADATETSLTRAVCSTATCPARGALKVITRTDGAPAQITVSDVLGREIQRAGVSFARQVVATDTLYDARGQALKTSRPYVTGAAAGTIKWHTFTYDAIGRPLTETAPDGSVTRSAYAGLTTTVTNAGGQVNKRKYNVRDELIRATDAAGTLTDYTYDSFGNLVKTVVDAAPVGKRVSTTHSYDTRGRKTGTTDPDRGNWRYRYNTLGELLRQTDARGQVTTYAMTCWGA